METIRVDAYRVRIPRQGAMRTDGLVFANEKLFEAIRADQSLEQVANVATLPGIVGSSLAMPDIHQGYGFPIGGVAAFDAEEGVISPGGVGYDINCGVRLLYLPISRQEVTPHLERLVAALARAIPSGVGSKRKDVVFGTSELERALEGGARWAVHQGFGRREDLERIEASGSLPGADPKAVSARALERGRAQVGTLGSGNHFVEVGFVDTVQDPEAARVLGLEKDQVTIAIHTGSRGLGYQVCDDHLKHLVKAAQRFGIELKDRQLCCAPFGSPEADHYLAAMNAAANFAFANRQLITHFTRQVVKEILGCDTTLVYDLAHNIAKLEEHEVNGKKRSLWVHRKGATRAFPPGHPELPKAYAGLGQPVLVPGDMGRYSFVLVGTEEAMRESFGSSCHGAGRLLSRAAAKRRGQGRNIVHELARDGIVVKGASYATVVEEMPEAYKDVSEVVDVVQGAELARTVARLRPLGVVKG
ncbi:MAG: RtcB family protein [Planctomycetota bacterium]